MTQAGCTRPASLRHYYRPRGYYSFKVALRALAGFIRSKTTGRDQVRLATRGYLALPSARKAM